jgi:transposase
MAERRKKRAFSEEFKCQMVGLYNAGKSQADICREYDLTPSALRNWVSLINKTGSSKIADNRTEGDKMLLDLQKENKQLRMENDILKQAALIFARRS